MQSAQTVMVSRQNTFVYDEGASEPTLYNYRRYYDPATGRYITQDPIGIEGGINQYRYAEADPVNLTDPTGEIVPAVAYAACIASCMLEETAVNAITGQCNNFGSTAGDCAKSCLLLGVGKLFKWGKRLWNNLPCAVNSFPAETVVHIKPIDAKGQNAQLAKTDLKPIDQLQVGDEVLALSEWKDKGSNAQRDKRLSYEKVTDIYTSHKAQTLVYLTLDNGETLTATEGHPLMTTEGWRDAVMLKKGGKLLLKGGNSDSDAESAAIVIEVRTEQKVLPVFNIEVANAHTYFVGVDGELVHNAGCSKVKALRNAFENIVKPKYWKDKARNNSTDYSQDDLAKMKKGRAPIGSDGNPTELHHRTPLEKGGTNDLTNIKEMTKTDHRLGDNYRKNHPK